jgi:hypothetical protein
VLSYKFGAVLLLIHVGLRVEGKTTVTTVVFYIPPF